MAVKIIGTGSALPAKIVSNAELAQTVDATDQWIRERSGIESRRISTGETVVSLAAQACERALAAADRKASNVELLLVATCTPERGIPCAACQVQDILGAGRAVAFDLNAACAGFLFALHTACAYLSAGIYDNALVAGSEVLSKILNWNDKNTCVLFGDGAGAVFVERSEKPGILGFVQHADGSRGEALTCNGRELCSPYASVPAQSPYLRMDGKAAFSFALRQAPESILEALAKAQLHCEDVDLYVLHQANLRIIEGIAKRLSLPMDRFPVNLNRVGNLSAASIPVLLDELCRDGRLLEGMTVVLAGFGAGLAYGACVLRW